ncbi:MAG: transposase [Collinsella aerofaciens]|nr:transposase [Collinsella aerofaciens]
MSAEGEAIRSNDYRKDTTVKAPSTRPAAVLGLDVGKSSHWACLIDRDGEVLASAPVRNREAELDALFASAPAGTLVVVDQFRNIGSLAVRRARAAGLGVAYLPGLAASRAAGLFAGEAKTDERDAAVIARTALGVPDSLSGVPGRGEALEAAVDLSDRRWLELLAGFGGAWGIARSGAGGPRAEAAGEAAAASTAPPPALVEAENRQVRFLAARISEALDEAGALEAETAALLEGDETYACLLTVPGIGPRTAAQLAVSVDIGRFPDHDHLASYCGIAPRVRSSGTSVRSVRASRRGDARLKSLLIFSCNSLVRSSGRYGEYYRACRARGMGHGRALKAVARKRLRAIYAVMRDRVPYRE